MKGFNFESKKTATESEEERVSEGGGEEKVFSGVEGESSLKSFEESLRELNDSEFKKRIESFLGEEVRVLSQAEVEEKMSVILDEAVSRNLNTFSLFSFILPDGFSEEELRSGNTPWAKVYKALFSVIKTEKYNNNLDLQESVSHLTDIISQNPHMVGEVALWEIAKDIMWRRNVSNFEKNIFVGGMTYALAFSDHSGYEKELLKTLDFENIQNYSETSHLLEAIKQFWSMGHESFAEDKVPSFYLQVLQKLEETPESNYILSLRAKEIKAMMEQSYIFPFEARDILPFELSKGVYASTQASGGLMVSPEENNDDIEESIKKFNANEEQITPPQWVLDEAAARGESWIEWQPSQKLMFERKRLFQEMHKFSSIPLEEKLGELNNLPLEKQQEFMFDYEYLLSRPVREMIQREFCFNLADLSLREQYFFLNFLKRTTVSKAEAVKKFTTLYGVEGMRTFLSLERGGESLGDYIVEFGQDEELARPVFGYFSQLLDSAEKAEFMVQEFSECEGELCLELTNQVRHNIINRAEKDLERAVKTEDTKQVQELIKNYIAEAKEYVALLQEVGVGNKIETVSSSVISEEDKKQMRELLLNNFNNVYTNYSDEEFKQAIFNSLTESFSKPNTVFKILRDQDKIISFNRVDTLNKLSDHEVYYFGSFNADTTYSGVGGIMLEKTLADLRDRGRPITAHCDPTQAVTKKYIESGFIATDFYTISAKPSFEIWQTASSTDFLISKQKTVAELLDKNNLPDSIIVRESDDFGNENYSELQHGFGLTRYFNHQGKTYLVFEELPETLKEEFTTEILEKEEVA